MIDVEIKGLRETQRRMEQLIRDLHGVPYLNAMRRATLIVQRAAKIKAPVDTGRLRASITPEVRTHMRTSVQGVVGSNVKYAPFRELGTRPHFVPAEYIGKWAERHDLGYRGLYVSGEATPFLEPALRENERKIIALLERVVSKIVYESEE